MAVEQGGARDLAATEVLGDLGKRQVLGRLGLEEESAEDGDRILDGGLW